MTQINLWDNRYLDHGEIQDDESFEAAVERWEAQSKEWFERNLAEITAEPTVIEVRTSNGLGYYINQTKGCPGQWQLTAVTPNGDMWGHDCYPSWQDALAFASQAAGLYRVVAVRYARGKVNNPSELVELVVDTGDPNIASNPAEFNDAFWKWFGDSKITSEDGTPLVAYHGTPFNFSKFSTDKLGSRSSSGGAPDSKEGFFFTLDPKMAEEFVWHQGEKSGSIMPVYLSIKNPMITDFYVTPANLHEFAELIKEAKRLRHDGVAAFMTFYDKTASVIVAFRPEQIKSATGNDGTWDTNDPDITSNPPGNVTVYHRYHGTDRGWRDVPWMLFTEDESAVCNGYGPYHFTATDDGSVDSADLEAPIIEALADTEYSAATSDEISPRQIVDTAGIWDSPEAVQIIWDRVLEPKGIVKVRTPDGLIVFDPSHISLVGKRKEILSERNPQPEQLPQTSRDLDNLVRYLVHRRALPAEWRALRVEHSPEEDERNQTDPRGFCHVIENTPVIYCSRALEAVSREVRLGILLHEIGHLVKHAFQGDVAEVDADMFCVKDVPEAGYTYVDYHYTSPWDGSVVAAPAIEIVTPSFAALIED